MTKFLFTLLVLAQAAPASALMLDIQCKNRSCLTEGWVMSDPTTGFRLDCSCKNADCTKFGWTSIDTLGTRFNIDCKAGGCFTAGWNSAETVNGVLLKDDATCIQGECLRFGWDIKTNYGFKGRAVCFGGSCGQNGGQSYWRGHFSQTICHNNDCYHDGWRLIIY